MKSKEFFAGFIGVALGFSLYLPISLHAQSIKSHHKKLSNQAIAAMLPKGARIIKGQGENDFFILGSKDSVLSVMQAKRNKVMDHSIIRPVLISHSMPSKEEERFAAIKPKLITKPITHKLWATKAIRYKQKIQMVDKHSLKVIHHKHKALAMNPRSSLSKSLVKKSKNQVWLKKTIKQRLAKRNDLALQYRKQIKHTVSQHRMVLLHRKPAKHHFVLQHPKPAKHHMAINQKKGNSHRVLVRSKSKSLLKVARNKMNHKQKTIVKA